MSPLVEYSDSDSDPEGEGKTKAGLPKKSKSQLKRKLGDSEPPGDLPQLPEAFLDLYATPVRTSTVDDPELHEGRQRTNVHVEGNWPSHVYIDWRPDAAAADWMKSVVRLLNSEDESRHAAQIRSSLENDVGTDLPLHISLSRSLNLQTDQKSLFLSSISSAIHKTDVKPFTVQAKALKWVPNYEGNRWFLIIQLQKPAGDELNKLLSSCNRVARTFGQPELYIDRSASRPDRATNTASKRQRTTGAAHHHDAAPSEAADLDQKDPFHVSIAWTLRQPDATLHARTHTLFSSAQSAVINISVRSVKLKLGNVIESVPLVLQKSSKKSLLG